MTEPVSIIGKNCQRTRFDTAKETALRSRLPEASGAKIGDLNESKTWFVGDVPDMLSGTIHGSR